ncbi:TMEM175 family protein [Nocardia sp. alder85J]|uniref:TMEM175 family protein n=1 Tax=Nocardia sp. alder85J TaxID=2862949 RepID=UPI001CD7E7FA|nr:TMEM175 family protein [Nocardia sp. alder85J]MCX4096152.1 TMEM175 family protein [Nocardia sp. alder85J]
MDRSRTEAFSDGVFAVAITLLVLNLHAPDGDLREGLTHMWPSYLAYVVSFLNIGIMWMNHHAMFRHVVRVDRGLQLANLLLLLVIVAVPFPTDLLGRQLAHELRGGDTATVTFVYSLVMIAMAAGFSLVWWYAVLRPGVLDTRLGREELRKANIRFSVGAVGYLAGTALALWEPLSALILFGLLSLYYAFEHLPAPRGDRLPTGDTPSNFPARS